MIPRVVFIYKTKTSIVPNFLFPLSLYISMSFPYFLCSYLELIRIYEFRFDLPVLLYNFVVFVVLPTICPTLPTLPLMLPCYVI